MGLLSHHKITSILSKLFLPFYKQVFFKPVALCSPFRRVCRCSGARQCPSLCVKAPLAQWLQLNFWQANSSQLPRLKERVVFFKILPILPRSCPPHVHSAHIVFEQTNWSGASSESFIRTLNISSQAFSERGIFIFPALLLSVLSSPVGQTCLLQLSKSSMCYSFCGCGIEPSGPTRKKFSSFVLLLVFGMGEGVGVKSRAGPCPGWIFSRGVKQCNWFPPWILSSWKTTGTILKF